MKRDVNIYYYKMNKDLGKSAITNLFASQPNPIQFVTNLFESSLSVGSEETTRRIILLNQISGPSLAGWNLSSCVTVVEGITYYQCKKGPDQWLKRAPIFNKDYELSICITKPQYTNWQPHPQHLRQYVNDNLSIITGTRNLTQLRGTDVIITYSTKMETYGKFMWMPLPQSPNGHRNLALITIEQKRALDNIFSSEDTRLMPPTEFRKIVIDMTIQNGFHSFVRMLILSCGKQFFGRKCISFIVSIVSDADFGIIREKKSI
jgi:hypothetical protein